MAKQTPTKSTAPLGSTQRTNDLLREASAQTGTNAPTFSGTSTPSQGGAVVGGRLVGSGGQDLGAANPADMQGAGSPRVSSTQPVQPQVGTQPLDPNAQAPQSLVDQTSQLQNQVNQVASSKGLKLQQNSQGGYSAVPDEAALRQQQHQALLQSGQQPATTQGGAAPMVRGAVNAPQTEPTGVVGSILNTSVFGSDGLKSILDEFYEAIQPQTQKVSLLDQYNQFSKSVGIDQLNADIINAKAIIDGNEDTIRAEITAAGGTATDRQIQAMTNSSNKQNILNYNRLVDTRTAMMDKLSTMMQLSVQDRQFAEAEIDRKLNFSFKVAEFKERATTNARTQMKYLIDNGFGGSLLTNPYDTKIAEKLLGVPPGGLSMMVAQKNQEKQKELEKSNLQMDVLRSNLSTDSLQRDKLRAEISTANKTIPGTPEYEAVQSAMNGSLINPTTGRPDPRGQVANIINATGAKTDDKLKLTGAVISATQALAEKAKDGKFAGINIWSSSSDFFRSPEGVSNALDLATLEGTVEAWMTGASVAEDQADRIKNKMLPKQGDTNGTIRKKVNALANYMINYTAGSLATQGVNWTPQTIDFFAPVTTTDPTGDEWVAQ